VNTSVYLLWFVQERAQESDTELLIGVYATESDARTAIMRLRDKPGFVDYMAGFQIEPYELGRDHWTEGFVEA
jgi:hypothetical protein